MTLPELMDKENAIDIRRLKTMAHTLNICVKQALKRKGLTCGMTSCGELLHKTPGTVMFCVLPRNLNISVHIHQTLIQAFCRENNILIIELGKDANLTGLLDKLVGRGRDIQVHGNPQDTSCMLIQYPKLGPSRHDQAVFDFYEEMNAMSYPTPLLTLPD